MNLSRSDRAKAIARRLLEIDKEEADLAAERTSLDAELNQLVGEVPVAPAAGPIGSIKKAHDARRKVPRSSLEQRVIAYLVSHDDRSWRASELATALGERADSVASTLVRAANDGKIDWISRGLYSALGRAKQLRAPQLPSDRQARRG